MRLCDGCLKENPTTNVGIDCSDEERSRSRRYDLCGACRIIVSRKFDEAVLALRPDVKELRGLTPDQRKAVDVYVASKARKETDDEG